MKAKHIVCMLLISVPLPAFAYIDPGSGSAIMSAIIGFLVASWLVVKTYWYKIKSFFRPSKDPKDPDQTNQQPPENPPEQSP